MKMHFYIEYSMCVRVCACVCVSDCDPQLFEKVTQLHACRLDLDALLAEEKKCADALKEECDTLVKKVTLIFTSVCLLVFLSFTRMLFCLIHIIPPGCVCDLLCRGKRCRAGGRQQRASWR